MLVNCQTEIASKENRDIEDLNFLLDDNSWLKSLSERNKALKELFEKDAKKPKVKEEIEAFFNPEFEMDLIETTESQDLIELKFNELNKKIFSKDRERSYLKSLLVELRTNSRLK